MAIRLNDTNGDRPLSNRARILIGTLIAGILITLGITHDPGPKDQPLEPGHTTTTRCFEDMPCWDCETMGNRLCGPQPITGKV